VAEFAGRRLVDGFYPQNRREWLVRAMVALGECRGLGAGCKAEVIVTVI
jgi:hypothetical protein